jgi:hypothetical protein
MDTCWFAVDDEGRVAIFESGEAGAVPTDAYLGEEGIGLALRVGRLRGASDDGGEPEDYDVGDLARRGLYVYEHSTENWIAGPYVREADPEGEPLREAELPDEIRAHLVRFAGSFARTAEIQPVELWPCEAWDAGYLASDGKTVRPIPGKEKEFLEENWRVDSNGEPYALGKPPSPPAPRRPWWKFW